MSRKRETQGSSSRPFRVYIGGLSASGEAAGLARFFSRFGAVDGVQYFPKTADRQSANNNTCNNRKSYYILTTRSEDAFQRIIDSQDIVYKNRKLICMKYMTGPELAKHNQDQNRRRFLIKYVPKDVSEASLRHFLDSQVGEVEILYRLENKLSPQEYSGQGNDHKFRTFGLLLKDRNVASRLPDLFSVSNRSAGWKISIQRFYYHKKEQASSNRLEERYHQTRRPCKTVQYPSEKTHHVHTTNSTACAQSSDRKESPATSFFGENTTTFSNRADFKPSNQQGNVSETRLSLKSSATIQNPDLDQWHHQDNIRINVAPIFAAGQLQKRQKNKKIAPSVHPDVKCY